MSGERDLYQPEIEPGTIQPAENRGNAGPGFVGKLELGPYANPSPDQSGEQLISDEVTNDGEITE